MTSKITVSREFDIKPFALPNHVVLLVDNQAVKRGYSENIMISLEELDSKTLSDMCDEFRKQVFARAKKEDIRPEPARAARDIMNECYNLGWKAAHVHYRCPHLDSVIYESIRDRELDKLK